MAQDTNESAPRPEAEGNAAAAAEAAASGDASDAPATAAGGEGDGPYEAPHQQIERLQGELAAAEAAASAAEDRALRAAAEAENTRRRTERSIENAHKFALERFVADLLPAVDSFERAADAAGGAEAAADAVAAIAEGVALSLKLLVGAMEKQGIAVVDPIGAPFDPKLHEAMSMVEKADAEPGSVVEVFQKGYTVNGRLARPARVIVAKAPPATDAEAAGEAGGAASAESPAQADGAGDAQDGA